MSCLRHRFGIVSHQMVADIDSDSIIAKREGSFQVELLLKTENVPSFLNPGGSAWRIDYFLSKGRSAV